MAIVPNSWKRDDTNHTQILNNIESAINDEIKASEKVIDKHGDAFPDLDTYIEGLEKALKIIQKNRYKT